MNFERLCNKILSLDSGFNFVAVITSQGRLEGCQSQQHIYRESLPWNFSPEEKNSFFTTVASRERIGFHFESCFGQPRYNLTEYENGAVMQVPLDEQKNIVVIVINPLNNTSPAKIANQVRSIAGTTLFSYHCKQHNDIMAKNTILKEYSDALSKNLEKLHEQERILESKKKGPEHAGIIHAPPQSDKMSRSKKLRASGLYI